MNSNTQNVFSKKVHVYKLIHFPEEEDVERTVDFVPAGWISYDPGVGLTCKFMPPPYNAETSELLHELIRTLQPAPETWCNYPVEIIGEADFYEEAVKKVDVLRTQRYAFSTDSEEGAEAKVLALKKIYKSEYKSNSHTTTEGGAEAKVLASKKMNKSEYKLKSHTTAEEEDLLKVPSLDDPDSEKQCQPSKLSAANMKPQIKTLLILKPARQLETLNETDKSQSHVKQGSKNADTIKRSDVSVQAAIKPKMSTVTAAVSGSTSVSDAGTSEIDSLKLNGLKPDDMAEAFLRAYRSHSAQMGQVQGALTETNTLLKSLLAVSKNPTHVLPELQVEKTFAEVYDIVLPFENLIAFEEFDARLAANKVMCAQLKRDMWPLIEPKGDVSRSISHIIKKYMVRAVVMNFTAVRKCGDKKLFKDTVFCTCVKEAVVQEFSRNPKKSPIRDKTFFDAVGTVINNAKDWEGQRVFRVKKNNAPQCDQPNLLVQKSNLDINI